MGLPPVLPEQGLTTPEQDLRVIEGATRLLDDAVRIPGTSLKIGLDPVLGLIPGVGDVTTAVMALVVFRTSLRLGVPRIIMVRMGLNIAFDCLMGIVPILGDAGDIVFKSNRRNMVLLQRYAAGPRKAKLGDQLVVWGVGAGLAAVMVGSFWLTWVVVQALFRMLSGS